MAYPSWPTTGANPWGSTLKSYVDAVGPAVSVMAYGAKGDNATDDTAAIHAARDAAAAFGADVWFPPGYTFRVNQCTASANNQTWNLRGATIKGLASATSFMLKVTGTDVTILGGTLDGSAVANPNMDNPFQSVADGTVWDSVTVKTSPGYGIKSMNASRQTVRNCRVINSSYEGIWFENNASGPLDIYDLFAIGNVVDGSTLGISSRTSGITIYGSNSSTHRVNRGKIIGNTVLLPSSQTYGASGGCAFIGGTDYLIADNIVNGANIAISTAAVSNGTISGNVVKGFSQIGIEVPVNLNTVAVGNNVVDGLNLGFRGIAATGTVTGLTVTGNVVKNLANASDSSITVGVCTDVAVTGNYVFNTNNVASRTGVMFTGAASGCSVTGNTIDGGTGTLGVGVQFLSSGTGIAVTGNSFSNLTRANVLWGASSGTLDFLNLAGNAQNNCAAMWLDAHTGSAVFGANNQLSRAAPVYNAGTSTVSAGYATDTYLTGSNVAVPTSLLQQKTMYRVRFNVSKTAAGTANPVITVRVGSAGTTADAAVATLTFSAGTAVADTGVFEVLCTFRSIGATATMWVVGKLEHNGTAVGLCSQITDVRSTVASSFNSTTSGNILGVSVNGGASAAWTTDLVQAELVNLAIA